MFPSPILQRQQQQPTPGPLGRIPPAALRCGQQRSHSSSRIRVSRDRDRDRGRRWLLRPVGGYAVASVAFTPLARAGSLLLLAVAAVVPAGGRGWRRYLLLVLLLWGHGHASGRLGQQPLLPQWGTHAGAHGHYRRGWWSRLVTYMGRARRDMQLTVISDIQTVVSARIFSIPHHKKSHPLIHVTANLGGGGGGGGGGMRLCRFFAQGNCVHGARCRHSHDMNAWAQVCARDVCGCVCVWGMGGGWGVEVCVACTCLRQWNHRPSTLTPDTHNHTHHSRRPWTKGPTPPAVRRRAGRWTRRSCWPRARRSAWFATRCVGV